MNDHLRRNLTFYKLYFIASSCSRHLVFIELPQEHSACSPAPVVGEPNRQNKVRTQHLKGLVTSYVQALCRSLAEQGTASAMESETDAAQEECQEQGPLGEVIAYFEMVAWTWGRFSILASGSFQEEHGGPPE